ncbi:hypothetical protein [uncultured Pseudoalteromonas sp.]|uniref:hypothetical protein n=1 Tax=uncultured Pseudoalteromonas sp. TaxID=114053 RepID=UPI002592AF89|nr:hypothetical protein [uncultured Pseudoalteromonas sp.]
MQEAQHSSELLSSFIHSYNEEQAQIEQQEQIHAIYRANVQDEIAILKSKLEAEKRLTAKLKEDINEKNIDLNKAAQAVEDGLIIAKRQTALNKEIDSLKNNNAKLHEQLKVAQKKVAELNQLNPKKLKEQIKRQKEASEKSQTRAKKLEQDNKKYRLENNKLEIALNKAVSANVELRNVLDRSSGTGLYHNGEHHLTIWPQAIKIEREDGSYFEGRTLLYLHQSGRGGLIAQDSEMNAHLCSAPKGGLRPNKATLEFASNWLTQVNTVQSGNITDADMLPVNFNSQEGDL